MMFEPSVVDDDDNKEEEEEEEENYESICNNAILDDLGLDRSLKKVHFDVTPFVTNDWDIFPKIFKAAILHTNIEMLYISSIHRGQSYFPSNLLIEALCNSECNKLKGLCFYDVAIGRAQSSNNDNDDQKIIIPNEACNNSLETLKFVGAENLDLSMVVEVARRCRSLVSLEIPNCRASNIASNLDLLDPLLLTVGDEKQQQQQQQPPLSLQHLDLYCNGINEEQAIAFFRKLPQMTCIRKIRLVHNPFESSEGWVPVLVDAIQHNTSVENLDLDGLSHTPELARACSKINVVLRRNQERRLTEEFLNQVRSKKVLPEKLWPLVLERAAKPISLTVFNPLNLFKAYYGVLVIQPSESVVMTDLVNRLLKEKMLQDHLY